MKSTLKQSCVDSKYEGYELMLASSAMMNHEKVKARSLETVYIN